MQGIDFPLSKTKQESGRKFNLNDPRDRQRYFSSKVGAEIEKLKKYLASGKTFVGYLLGKKNSGKGTYSKLFMEALGTDRVGHVAVGDIVRDVHSGLADPATKKELSDFLSKNYRGFHSLEEIEQVIEGRSQSTLVPTELILALLKFEISKRPRQALFIDGFPRGLDQIGYSLYLKELLGYRDDPDFFVFISLPNTVLDERIKYRVICPICKTPRSTKLLATSGAGYDEAARKFYLICDNPPCNKARMVPKEGDELGIEPIRARLETDDQIFRKLLELQGVPKVYLRNAVPSAEAKEYVDDYELTPAYGYELDQATKNVKILESPWVVEDDDGIPSYSLLPPAVVVSLIRQVVHVLKL
ncbi:MAG: nucleoside monophosphate kinase [Candidatus Liptonbacteria bacterium]|nr:nucleoside monophosphate kinase [Candidatus Liptonbacteria bacterium]